MKKLLFFIFAISCFSVFAQPSFLNRKDIIKKLDLSKDQVSTIENMRTKHQKSMIDFRADLQKLQIEKRELIKKGDFNRKALTEMEEKLTGLRNKMHMANFNHRMDVLAQLTPEQREKVPGMLHDMKQKMGKGRHMKGGRGFGNGAGAGMNRGICPNL